MFAPYVQPDLPNGYKINGKVTELTPEEQENRRKLIEAAIRENNGLEEQSGTEIDSGIEMLTFQV